MNAPIAASCARSPSRSGSTVPTKKDEILAAYLNEVYFGAGAYGISAAAASFFDKRPEELTLGEAAILAGAVNAPSEINPRADARAAAQRAERVVEIMVETGVATGQEALEARSQIGAIMRRDRQPADTEPGWFGDWAYQQAVLATAAAPREAVIRATTTLDPSLQALAQKIMTETMAEEGSKLRATEAALVAMRPDGAVLALVGGVDYRANRFNRATQARRQPGSLFKLFVYYAAIRNGWQPDHTVMDEPIEIDGWEPGNFDDRFRGEMTLRKAFATSRNVPAVQLAMDVGIEEVEEAARDLGIVSPLAASPSLALGTSEVTLLEITGAFASVRAGRTIRPRAITRIAFEGDVPALSLAPPADSHVIGEHRPALLTLLRDAVRSGTGREAAMGERFVAGKTGTSQNHRDAWFVGFSEDLVVGVWVGNDDNSPMKGVTGGSLPARIWKRFVSSAEVPEQGIRVASLDFDDVFDAALDEEESENEPEIVEAASSCNIAACSARYRSFRASDCTFQPYEGPRRICTATRVPDRDVRSNRTQVAAASSRRATAAAGSCNISACSARYRSFRASDCTYQPYDGPRRLCTAGGGGVREDRGQATTVTAYVDEEPVRRIYRAPAMTLFDRIFAPSHNERRTYVIRDRRHWRGR